MVKRISHAVIFFIGWILSPLTWWNDQFVNIPLSYLLANLFFYIFPLHFKWILIISYYFTNLLGILFMYWGGKNLIVSFRDKLKALAIMLVFLVIYTAAMLYLDYRGKLLPLDKLFPPLEKAVEK